MCKKAFSAMVVALALFSCNISQPITKASVDFKNNHSASIVVSWGDYAAPSGAADATYTEAGHFTLTPGSTIAASIDPDLPYNVWYMEGSVRHILYRDASPAQFSFRVWTTYSITFHGDYTYTYVDGSVSTTPPGGDTPTGASPVVVYKPVIVNVSTDTEAAAVTVDKGNCWYHPDSKRLFLAILLKNMNAFSVDLSTWMFVFKDVAGNILYSKSALLNATSTTPLMYTFSFNIFPFDVDAGAHFYLSPLGPYSYIQLGNADTLFSPDQIAKIEISSALSPSFLTGTIFIPLEKQIQLTGWTPAADHIEATLRNGSAGIAYNTTLAMVLATDNAGDFVGLDRINNASWSSIGVVAAAQTVTAYCFKNNPDLARITGVELVPYVTYESGSSLSVHGGRGSIATSGNTVDAVYAKYAHDLERFSEMR